MSKKRKIKRKKSLTSKTSKSRKSNKVLVHVNYNVSYEPLEKEYPDALEPQMEALLMLATNNPEEAIPRLMELKDQYSTVPELYNWLSVAQTKTGDKRAADLTTRENYEKNPDYLFAKLGYAEICMDKGDLNEIAKIFDKKFDLSFHYPERETFHISEVMGFYGVIGMYLAEIGNEESARVCLDILNQLEPDHGMTIRLKILLKPNNFSDLLKQAMTLTQLTGRK